jgi:hypothetical protein
MPFSWRPAAGKTRFKMWWRLIGSAVEHGAKLVGDELDFQTLFLNASTSANSMALS